MAEKNDKPLHLRNFHQHESETDAGEINCKRRCASQRGPSGFDRQRNHDTQQGQHKNDHHQGAEHHHRTEIEHQMASRPE